MNNQDAMEDIFNPKPMEIQIGDPNSQILACGKNQNCELTFKGYNYLMFPCGLKMQKKNKIIDIATGREHTALLTEYGYVYVFGSTLHNKLGLEGTSVTNISSPKLLPLSQEIQLVQVACGDYHTLALTEQGEVWGFGGTLHKKTGDKNPRPSPVRGLDKITIIKIGCGDFHSVALSDQGILFTWGGGGSKYNRGQLGHGISDDVMTPLPVKFFQNSPVYDFECGGYHTVSIQSDGEVFAWGNGQFGQLGNGTFEDTSLPKRVEFSDDIIIVQVACGGHHTYYLSKEGKLYSCGKGTQGQTGQLKAVNYPNPTLVQCLQYKTVEQISCGWNHAIALVNPNHVYSTGLNNYGQLGIGHQDNKMGFTWVERLAGKNVTTIKAGGDHSWFIIDIESPLVDNYRPPSPLYTPPEEPIEKKSSISRQAKSNFLNKKSKSNFRERQQGKNNNLGPRKYNNDLPDYNKNRKPFNQGMDKFDLKKRQENPIEGENIFVDEDDSQEEIFSEDVQDPNINENSQKNPSELNVFKNSVDENQFERESKDFNNPNQNIPQTNTYQDQPNPQIHSVPNPQKNYKETINQNPLSLTSLENSSKKPKINNSKSFLKKNENQPKKIPRKKFGIRQTQNFLKQPSKQNNSQQQIPPAQKIPQDLHSHPSTFNNENPYINQEDDDPQDPFKKGHRNNLKPQKPQEYGSQPNKPFDYPQAYGNQPPVEIDENRRNFILNKIWQQSAYNMLFVDLDLNHKFILLDYKPNKQNELLQAIHNSIEQIQAQDPILIQTNVVKYNDFVSKDNKGFLKRVMDQTVQIEQGMSENIFVVMLVQQQDQFMSQYSYSVPQSNYNQLNFRESSLGPFYQYYPEDIESDKKWKLLSLAYEILLGNVYEFINLFTIYELRSNKYK